MGINWKKDQSTNPLSPISEPLVQKLFAAAADSMFVVDGTGAFIAANTVGCVLSGYSQEALWQLTLADLFSAGTAPARPLQYDDLPREEAVRQGYVLHERNGRSLPVDIESSPLGNGRLLLTVHPAIDSPRFSAERVRTRMEIKDLAKFPGENPQPIMRVAQDGIVLYANQASTPLLENWGSAVDRPLPGVWQEHIRDTLASGVPKEEEIAVDERVFSLSIVPLVEDGYANIYGYDVTDRKQAQKELQESQDRLVGIIASAMDAIISLDEDQRIVLFNAAAEQMFGYTAATVIGQPHDRLLPERFRAIHQLHIRGFGGSNITSRKMDHLGTLWAVRADGQEFPVEVSISQVQVGGKKLYTAIIRDVTQREQALAALRESQEILTTAEAVAKTGSWKWDLNTQKVIWSAEMYNLFGVDEANFDGDVNKVVQARIHPDDIEIVNQSNLSVLEHLKPRPLEYRIVLPDGTERTVWAEGRVTYDQSGDPTALVGYVQDITERKQVEATIGQLHQRMELILNSAGEGIYGTDMDGRITFVNPAMARMTGWEPDELLGRNAHTVFHHTRADGRPYPAAECSIRLAMLNDRSYHVDDDTYWRQDGTPLSVEYTSTAIRQNDQIIGTVVVVKDITERKQAANEQARLEEQLRQAQKMESIGRLAGGVAHDFNNQLTIIHLYSDLMRAGMAKNDPLLAKLERIRKASERATDLTQQLLAFSRKQILQPVILNLNELVTNLQKMLARLIGEDITLSTVLEPGLWPIMADRGQIEQVIMNLVVNARDAMPTGGLLTIETGNLIIDEQITSVHLDIPPGPCVMLAVNDTGHGMDKATQNQIFEPFFTTKEVGKGTGLGLATVHGIVKQSGGAIYFYSEPGQGATFKIYLPASESETARLVGVEPTRLVQRGHETILLVEDEAALRELVRETLQEMGYTVLEAGNGREALDLADQHPASIDLLLADVVMPQMGGGELFQALIARRPNVKVLFMSGYMDNDVVRHGVLTAEMDFLSKPFTRSTLASKVREVLDKA